MSVIFRQQTSCTPSPKESILICEVTPPSLVTLLPHLSGVIAKHGSIADHFASVSREFGIPVLVQAGENCLQLKDGEPVTLWAEQQSVYSGTLNLSKEATGTTERTRRSPFYRTLKMVIDFTSPLALVNPASPKFCPENCRSLHDILRFTHEKSVQAMFIQSTDGLFRKPKGARLQSDIPLQVHIIDLGGGLAEDAVGKADINIGRFALPATSGALEGLISPRDSLA